MIDLSLKMLGVLGSKEEPVFPPHSCAEKKPENAELMGHLPGHLRRLYAHWKSSGKVERAEINRRCEEFFGRKEYDNERIEYMFYNEVRADPNFGGVEVVKALLDWAVRWHFPKLPVDCFDRPRYYVDEEWGVWADKTKRAAPKIPSLPTDILIV